MNKHCLAEFRKHWTCLDNNNQQLWQCRPAEWKLNKCVFDNLVRIIYLQLPEIYGTNGYTQMLIQLGTRKSKRSFLIPPPARHLYTSKQDKSTHTTDHKRCTVIRRNGSGSVCVHRVDEWTQLFVLYSTELEFFCLLHSHLN